ncbi:hypothetical protein Dimus_008476 [Dionaea muscipula]
MTWNSSDGDFHREDVKMALFDIVDDKAPGVDGFTSAFFKKSFESGGDEVCRAIPDFFKKGVNAYAGFENYQPLFLRRSHDFLQSACVVTQPVKEWLTHFRIGCQVRGKPGQELSRFGGICTDKQQRPRGIPGFGTFRAQFKYLGVPLASKKLRCYREGRGSPRAYIRSGNALSKHNTLVKWEEVRRGKKSEGLELEWSGSERGKSLSSTRTLLEGGSFMGEMGPWPLLEGFLCLGGVPQGGDS